MAKQTYTTGQVLTAAQMTTLQANDYNQTVSAKVASYTLVAADVGTRITMSNASATAITVNTGIFAAGDTLEIMNIGAGACTVTAGTATVSTSSSAVLAQYESGVLYFTSTGVSVWQKYDGAAASSSTTLAQIASGSTTSGTSLSLTGLTSYDTLKLRVSGSTTSANNGLNVTINSSGSSVYDYLLWNPYQGSSSTFDGSLWGIDERETTNTMFNLIASGYEKLSTNTTNFFEIDFYNCKATGFTTFEYQGIYATSAGSTYRSYPMGRGIFKTAAAVSSIQFKTSSAFTAGSYILWGG